jgi:2-polyprenyl-3-methyl-5-hydroxy-6-metoxy-1,4-benzoquinol methylase
MKPMNTNGLAQSDLVDLFGDDDPYLRFHAERIVSLSNVVVQLVGRCQERSQASVSVLDVGPSFQTGLIAYALDGLATVDALGLPDDPVSAKFPMVRRFIGYDLNCTRDRQTWVEPDLYDVVVFGEVLEHLHTAPQTVLAFLCSLLKVHGAIVIQTPNAASLPKRLALLQGRNPYEAIRIASENPGHFRESTASELIEFCRAAKLQVETVEFTSHWETITIDSARSKGVVATLKADVLQVLARLVPSFREGITIVAHRL